MDRVPSLVLKLAPDQSGTYFFLSPSASTGETKLNIGEPESSRRCGTIPRLPTSQLLTRE